MLEGKAVVVHRGTNEAYFGVEGDPVYENDAVLRSQRVAEFLLAYIDRQSRSVAGGNDPVFSAYLEVERWVALAFFDPDAAAHRRIGGHDPGTARVGDDAQTEPFGNKPGNLVEQGIYFAGGYNATRYIRNRLQLTGPELERFVLGGQLACTFANPVFQRIHQIFQLPGHRVERCTKSSNFVVGSHFCLNAEVTICNFFCRTGDLNNWF